MICQLPIKTKAD